MPNGLISYLFYCIMAMTKFFFLLVVSVHLIFTSKFRINFKLIYNLYELKCNKDTKYDVDNYLMGFSFCYLPIIVHRD